MGCRSSKDALDSCADVDVVTQQHKVIDCTIVAGSIKVKLVPTKVWLSTIQTEPMVTCWIALVRPCDGQKEPEGWEDHIDG